MGNSKKIKESSHLKDMMSRLLGNGLFSDVVLLVGAEGYEIKSHKMVLGGRSPVFETMLQRRWTEQQTLPGTEGKVSIRLEEHEVESVKTFLQVCK